MALRVKNPDCTLHPSPGCPPVDVVLFPPEVLQVLDPLEEGHRHAASVLQADRGSQAEFKGHVTAAAAAEVAGSQAPTDHLNDHQSFTMKNGLAEA